MTDNQSPETISRATMPHDIDLEEHARELAARDWIVQHSLGTLGIKDISPQDLTPDTRRNEDTEKL